MKSVNNSFRIRVVSFCVVLVAALFLCRLFFLQVVRGEYYSDQVNKQYLSPAISSFDRGSIYFTEKTGKLFSAATVKTGYFLAINPSVLSKPESVYEKINSIVPVDRDFFMKKASRKKDTYEEIAHRLSLEEGDRIRALDYKGVMVYKEKWRFYPAGRLASHVIGLLAFRGDVYAGRYGLEKEYDGLLRRDSNVSFVNYFATVFLDLGRQLLKKNDQQGGDIVLTIEPMVQNYLEKQIADLNSRYSPQSIGAIIMDPQTGEIAAMAALPNFEPGGRQTDISVLPNPLVEKVYEMGSVVKPLTIAAAMNEGLVNASTTYLDNGTITLNNKTIHNHDDKVFGRVTMQKVLDDSINTGAVFAGQKLGHDNFRKYFLNYGIREKTGIDLPDEIKGLSGNLDSNREVEFATASFGQGVSWTPVGITRALACLGNGGYLVRPHVIKSFRYGNMASTETATKPLRQVLKTSTSQQISSMLISTFDRAMIGGKYKMPRYTVAAKTGTAQIAIPGGGYYGDRYLHSFFGYFPATKPRFVVFIYMVNPKGVAYASESLAGPFSELTHFLINYYEIAPDR